MKLMICDICDKNFPSAGRRICPACLKSLDELYLKVHQFLRVNTDTIFNIENLSEILEINARKIQALVDMGYLGRSSDGIDNKKRLNLLKELEDTIKQMKDIVASSNIKTTYGVERYGVRENKKNKQTTKK